MNPAKKGLGRGLSALFGDIENKTDSTKEIKNKIPIADLERNKYQPRTIFDEEKLNELSSSILSRALTALPLNIAIPGLWPDSRWLRKAIR